MVEGKMSQLDYIRILDENLLPLIGKKFHNKNYSFQDDNTPIHTAKDVKN